MNVFDTIATVEPSEIVAGDFIQWRRDDLDYLNTVYDLKYRIQLAGNADASLDVDGVADGAGFLISIPSATTQKWIPGDFDYHVYIERKSDNERVRIGVGTLKVIGNFDGMPGDFRSHARRMLASIEALLEGRTNDVVDNYSIGSRSITKMSVEELMKWRSYYLAEVEGEKQIEMSKQGKGGGNAFQVQFARRF